MVNLKDSSNNQESNIFALIRLGYKFAGSFPLEDAEAEVRSYQDCGFDIRFSRIPISPNGREKPVHMINIFIRNPQDRPEKLSDGDITDTLGKTFIGQRMGIDRDSLGCYYPLTRVGYMWETNVLRPERLKGVVSRLEAKGCEVRVSDIAVDNEGQILANGKVAVFIRNKEKADKQRLPHSDVERYDNGEPIPMDISLRYFA